MAIKRNLFRDVLRDTNSIKYSMTKLTALLVLLILLGASVIACMVMIEKNEIDHIFIGELIALLLTVLGYKNFKSNSQTVGDNPSSKPQNEEAETSFNPQNDKVEIDVAVKKPDNEA